MTSLIIKTYQESDQTKCISEKPEKDITLWQKSFSRIFSFTLLKETVHQITGKFKGEQCHVIA
jgi:hypothetical protein